MQAWILRAADLGIIDRSHAKTLFTQMSSRGWRREEPVEFGGEEHPRKLKQLTVRALAEGLVSRAQAERICPGVTRDVTDKEPTEPLDARTLAGLPESARDRLMAQAAAMAADEYEAGGGLAGFEALSEEDHFDESFQA